MGAEDHCQANFFSHKLFVRRFNSSSVHSNTAYFSCLGCRHNSLLLRYLNSYFRIFFFSYRTPLCLKIQVIFAQHSKGDIWRTVPMDRYIGRKVHRFSPTHLVPPALKYISWFSAINHEFCVLFSYSENWRENLKGWAWWCLLRSDEKYQISDLNFACIWGHGWVDWMVDGLMWMDEWMGEGVMDWMMTS